MAACHQKWLNDSRVLLLKCLGKFPIRKEFIVWRRWGGKLHSLNLFNTKMTSANKARRGSLIGAWGQGQSLRKQPGHPGVEPLHRPFEDSALFHPHSASFCLIHLYPLSSASLSICVTHPFFMLSFIPQSLSLAYQNPMHFPHGLSAINANWRQGTSLSSSLQVYLYT